MSQQEALPHEDGSSIELDIPERLSLRLSAEAQATLRKLAALKGQPNISELIRRAIGTELMLAEATERGETLLLEKPNGRMVELRPVR